MTGRLARSHLLGVLIAGAVCLLTFQGRRVLTEHEVFAAEPGREMLAGKGLLLQPFAGEYRTKKPPGQSWLIALSLGVTRSHSEWAARLPSALAGIGLAVVVASMAARVGTSRQGLIAGLMTLTCLGVQQRARLAEADMALALCVAIANAMTLSGSLSRYAGGGLGRGSASDESINASRQTPSRPRACGTPREYTGEGIRKLSIVFWSSVAFGFLIKGPVVLGFTVLPAVASWAVLRFGVKNRPAATGVRKVAFWWPAVLGGVGVIALWVFLALREYPPAWDVWMHELSRVKGDVGHGEEQRKDPLFAYAWLLPQSTLPWCVFAIFGASTAWALRRRPGNVVLASWGVGGFILVSLSAFKVLHYILPVIAPVLMLAAVGFDRLLQRFLHQKTAEKRKQWERLSLAGWFGVAAVAWLVWAAAVVPQKDWGRKVRAFAHAVSREVPVGEMIYLYHPGDRTGEDQAAWYLDHPLKQTETPPDRLPAYVICSGAEAEKFAQTHAAKTLLHAEPELSRDGTDRNDRVLVLIPARPPKPQWVPYFSVR